DLAQFWPDGTSDADTLHVLPDDVAQVAIDRQPALPSAFFVDALANGHPVVRAHTLTVRLEGVDAPELHYRPPGSNAPVFRQAGAERAVLALRRRLAPRRVQRLRCEIVTAVAS